MDISKLINEENDQKMKSLHVNRRNYIFFAKNGQKDFIVFNRKKDLWWSAWITFVFFIPWITIITLEVTDTKKFDVDSLPLILYSLFFLLLVYAVLKYNLKNYKSWPQKIIFLIEDSWIEECDNFLKSVIEY